MGNTNSSAPKAKTVSASFSSNLAAAAADDPNVNVLPRPIPKNVTPLKDCKTLDEHEACIHYAHEITRGLHGLEGLHALGFDYRFVPCCAAHDPSNLSRNPLEACCVEINQDTRSGDNDEYESNTQQQQSQYLNRGDHEDYNMNIQHGTRSSSSPANETSSTATTSKLPKSQSVISLVSNKSSINEQYANHCQYGCATRLFFVGPTLVSRLMQNKQDEENEDREGGESLDGEGKGERNNIKPLKEGANKEENDMMERSHAKEQHDGLAEDTSVNQSNQTSPSTKSRVDESPAKSSEQHHPAVSANSSLEQRANTPTPNTSNEASTQSQQRPNESEPAVMITTTNRQEYIADGSMYELLANLAQEMAQSKMCTAFDLEWITVCDEIHLGEHVRALVDKDHRRLLEEGENKVVLQELLLSSPSSVKVGEEEKEEKKDEDHNHDNSESHQSSATSTVTHQYHSQNDNTKPHQTSLNKTKSTLLIATGRGKVRAGIFSRHHLLTAGIEVGTSWHCIREARMRNWGVAIIDPNARGEEVGYESFKRSMSRLFLGDTVDSYVATADDQQQQQHQTLREQSSANGTTGGDGGGIDRQSSRASLSNTTTSATSAPASSSTSSSHSIYILAHSASGGQLVRHLREDPTLLPSISAIAFTDSTHNVQWCKHDPTLKDFLQKKNCVYLRSNDVRSSQSCVKVSSRGKDIWCNCITCVDHKKSAGMEADTDNFWEHRFGSIKTVWAGTADHALSNWAGHASIWDHFDEHANSDDDDC